MGVPIPLGTWHQKDDALGTFPPLHEVKVWSQGKSYALKHLGGAHFRDEAPSHDSPGLFPTLPHQREVRTTLKSRWSLVYCHMLPRRLAAALEDFSLSELEQREKIP